MSTFLPTVQWLHAGSLELIISGAFILFALWGSANSTNLGSCSSSPCWLIDIYWNTTSQNIFIQNHEKHLKNNFNINLFYNYIFQRWVFMCWHLNHYCHVLYASKTSHYHKIKPINFLFPPYLFIALSWPFLKLQLSCSCAAGTKSSSLSSCLECFFSQQNSIECPENNGNICSPHFLSSYTILEMIKNLNNDPCINF